jgi:hypothetical protein
MNSLKILLTIALIVLLALAFTSCGNDLQNADELLPVRHPDNQTSDFLDQIDHQLTDKDLSKMSAQQFAAYIYKQNPDIDWNVRNDLLRWGKINRGEKITLKYHYFAGDNKAEIQDATGNYHLAKFKNKFVVELIRQDGKKVWISLACLNGMLEIDGKPSVSTESVMEFTISKGKGLSYYLQDDNLAIDVAQAFGLTLYKGKIQKPKYKISYAKAVQLVPDVDSIQITVHDKIGWHFILRGNNWLLNGRPPKTARK